MTTDFWLQFSHLEWALAAALLLVFAYEMYYYLRYMAAPDRQLRRQEKAARLKADESLDESTVKGVSVIVCARNEEENLRDYLQTLLTQDYPVFEVILINDGSEDHTADLVQALQNRYHNLHYTFVPAGARICSTKKLAITLGAKAAKYDFLLLTDADCRPETNQWIRAMMEGFRSEDTEIVLGFGGYFMEKRAINHLIQYDTLFVGLQYMGQAIAHHPYMGVGRNMAYRKKTFFEHHGFSGMLGQRAGDDDLFVNRVANRYNTAVVCTPDSITWSVPKRSFLSWCEQKRRHLSVANLYKAGSQFRLLIEPVMRAAFYGLIIAIGICCTWPVWILAIALFLLRWIMQAIVLNIAAHRLGTEHFYKRILWYDIALPVLTLVLMAWPKPRFPQSMAAQRGYG